MKKRSLGKQSDWQKKIQIIVGVVVLLLVLAITGCTRQQVNESRISQNLKPEALHILLIHNNPCESCDERAYFLELMKEVVPEHMLTNIEVTDYYAYSGKGKELVEQAVTTFGLEKITLLYPLAIIGNQCLSGYTEIQANLTDYLLEAQDNGILQPAMEGIGQVTTSQENDTIKENKQTIGAVNEKAADSINLLYFHTESCAKCDKAEDFLDELSDTVTVGGKEYSLVITKLSLVEEKNAALYSSLVSQYNVPEKQQRVPFVFLGEIYLSGESQIRSKTLQLLEKGEGIGAGYDIAGNLSEKASISEEAGYNLFQFLIKTLCVGFLNGFNLCSLSLVLLFFSLLGSTKKGFLPYGISFLAGKFIAYILLGMTTVRAITIVPLEIYGDIRYVSNMILIVCCLILACGNFLDSFHAWRGEYGKIRLQLPGKLRSWNDSFVKKIAGSNKSRYFIIFVFGGSMIIAIGEFFCTGQIYLVSILQWMQNAQGRSIPILTFVLYSASLCLPALIILILIYRGKSIHALTNVSLKHMPMVKLFNGILFLIFGFLFLFL